MLTINNFREIAKGILKRVVSCRVANYIIIHILKVYIYLVFFTSKIECRGYRNDFAEHLNHNNAAVLISWHGEFFILAAYFRKFFDDMNFKRNINILSSSHRDGKLSSAIAKKFGFRVIFGSTINKNRSNCVEKSGAVRSIIEIIREIENKSVIYITPDGPRGPSHRINSRIVDIAGRHNTAIFGLRVYYSKGKQLNSWDKFLLPLPFGKIVVEFLEPLYLKSTDDFEECKKTLENRMGSD